MRIVLAAPRARVAVRLCAVLAGAALVACGEVGPSDEIEQSAAALEEGYVGDRGVEHDAREVDPTRSPTFRTFRTAGDGDGSSSGETPPAPPAKVVLRYTWFGQETGYWCGPGSLRMALSTKLSTLPTQTALAQFMGTTSEGTVRADAIRALNNYLAPKEPYVSIPMDGRPTQEQRDLLKRSVVKRLSSGYPVVANVLSGWRPPGYPSGTIGHFVAVVGYDDSGDKVLIADPAAAGSAGPRWEDVPKTYWISMQNLGTWIGARGYSGY